MATDLNLGLINPKEATAAGIKEFGSTVYNNAKTMIENPECIFSAAAKSSIVGHVASKLGVETKNEVELENAFTNAWDAYNENLEEQKAQGKETIIEKAVSDKKGAAETILEILKTATIGPAVKSGLKIVNWIKELFNKSEEK